MGISEEDLGKIERMKETLRGDIVGVMVLKNELISILEGLSEIVSRPKEE